MKIMVSYFEILMPKNFAVLHKKYLQTLQKKNNYNGS